MNGLAVKHRLLDRGMTLLQLASITGMTYDRLVKVVNGYREPRTEEVRAIAAALGLPDSTVSDSGSRSCGAFPARA